MEHGNCFICVIIILQGFCLFWGVGRGGGLSVHVVKPLNGENEGLKVVSAPSQPNEFISVVLSSIHYVNIYFLS